MRTVFDAAIGEREAALEEMHDDINDEMRVMAGSGRPAGRSPGISLRLQKLYSLHSALE